MRIAVADPSSKTGLSFSHSRVADAPDLVLTVRNLSSPSSSGATDDGELARGPEPRGAGASPGRLVTFLPSQELLAEATTRQRLAAYRVTVPEGDTLEVRLAWQPSREAGGAWTPARGRQALNGSLTTEAGAALHAAVRFGASFTAVDMEPGISRLRFTPPAGVLEFRIALSTTDLAGARGNLADGEGLGFEGVLHATRAAWDALLGRFTVVAGDEEQARITTDWYRVLATYGRLEDRDGRYRAPDGSLRRVGDGQGFIGNLDLRRRQWTVLPLMDLVAPELLQGLPETLLLHQRVTGRFPGRTAWGRPQDPDMGSAQSNTVASAVLAGFVSRTGDASLAARTLPPVIKASRTMRSRHGYVPFDDEGSLSVTRTLAASRGAHAVAVIAAAAGDRDTAGAFAARAVFHRLLYDPETGAFRGKDHAGRWRNPFPPTTDQPAGFADYEDGRWAEALWIAALFDIDGLLGLLGGQQALADRLDAAFEAGAGVAGLDPFRPSMQHTPWLYGFTNHPERIGMSLMDSGARHEEPGASAAARRLFRVLGLYPVLPAEGEYMLSPPLVREALLRVEGRSLRFIMPGQGPEAWQGGVYVDGQPLPGRLVSYRRLLRGGIVAFEAVPGRGRKTARNAGR
jgi:putative alpha-1,2-mannosidase